MARSPSPRPGRGRDALSRLRRLPVVGWLAIAAGGAVAVGLLAGVVVAASIHRPRVESVAEFTPSLITQLYDSTGVQFASYARERRVLIPDGGVPSALQNALVAAEDSNFFEHGGVDAEGVVRAAMRNVTQGEIVLGASTITMQLARQLFLTREKTWRRKVEEAFLSVELEKNFSKQQIMTLYCNVIFLGHGNYGMAAAARDYFDKPVEDLTAAEAATLAGIIQQPSRLSPYRSPELVVQRRNYVLRRMFEEGYLDDAQYQEALDEPLEASKRSPSRQVAPYLAEDVRRHLESQYGTDTLLESGLQVHTTLDRSIQSATQEAVEEGLMKLDRRRGWRGPFERLEETDLEAHELSSWRSRELVPGIWSPAIVLASDSRSARVKVGDNSYTLNAKSIQWTRSRSPAELLERGDVVWVQLMPPEAEGDESWVRLEQEPELEGVALVLESATGAVRAMVGGWDFRRSKFNRATQARRQVGSAFKPIVFGAALESGFTPADTFFDGPVVFQGEHQTASYSPRNYYRQYYGMITLRWALEHSANVTAVKLQDLVGVEAVIDFARRSGFTSELPPYPSLALGSADLSPLELAAAYAAMANQGLYLTPYLIDRVVLPDGRVLEEHPARAQKAMEPEIAYLLTHMLEGVIDRGTATKLKDLDIDLAGKTGTTDAYTDAWFVGFTPRYTILTWVGHDVKRSIGRNMTGAEAALPIWRQIVVRGLDDGWLVPGERFVPPPGVVLQPIEPMSGLLAGPDADTLFEESFIEGTGPVRAYDRKWGRILELPWYQQRPFYIPKERERMPDDITDWSLVQRAWATKGG